MTVPSLFAVAKHDALFWAEWMWGLALAALGLLAMPASLNGDIQAIAISIGLVACGALLCALAVRKVAAWKSILAAGVPVDARVIAITVPALAWRLASEWQRLVRYRYADAGGRERRGRTYLSRVIAGEWQAGDKCLVLTSPRAPRASIWIGRQ